MIITEESVRRVWGDEWYEEVIQMLKDMNIQFYGVENPVVDKHDEVE